MIRSRQQPFYSVGAGPDDLQSALLIDRPQHVGARGEGFVRRVDVSQQWNCREFRISLSYNFKSGKAFKRRAVEAGSADEKSRL